MIALMHSCCLVLLGRIIWVLTRLVTFAFAYDTRKSRLGVHRESWFARG
jgi:hypothetical protein